MKRLLGSTGAWLRDYGALYLVDHGFLRSFWANRYKLAGRLYRANQPSPMMVRWYRDRLGIRTIINLRGENDEYGFYRLEKRACEQLGVRLVNARTWSRGLLTREQIHHIKRVIELVETPAMAHCKSGADRAGYFSVLWRHWRLGEPIEVALEELHWRYGHFKSAKTGMLDHFFQTYLKERRPNQSLIDWVDSAYSPKRMEANFSPKSWVSWFVDDFLRRE